MTMNPRIAVRIDYHALVQAREERLDDFYRLHCAEQPWCPALMSVPCMVQDPALIDHLRQADGRDAALVANESEPARELQ